MASIEKRTTRSGARYRAKVLVRQDPKTGKIKFISKSFDRRKDAEQWAREREVAKGKNELPEPTKESLAVYSRRYLDNVIKKKVRPRTYQGYSSVLRRYLEDPPHGAPLIGDLRLDRITPEALELLYGWMQNEQGLSAGTVRSLHAVLRQVIQKAARRRRLTLNVADLVDLPTKHKREVQAMSEEELRLFLKAGEGDRHYASLSANLGETRNE